MEYNKVPLYPSAVPLPSDNQVGYSYSTSSNYHQQQQQPSAPGFTTQILKDPVIGTTAVNDAIQQNGRSPVTVLCPSCNRTTLTETTEVQVEALEGERSRINRIFFISSAVVMVIIFVGICILTQSFVPLGILPIFLLFELLGFCALRWVGRCGVQSCPDVQHRCNHCKVLLGTNSGAELYKERGLAPRVRINRVRVY